MEYEINKSGRNKRLLTADQVRHIRKARKDGVTAAELQKQYKCSRSVIDKVARYASYTDIFDDDERKQ